MLHQGILPYHARWSRLLSNLRYVVVDEIHSYRGIFGSHVSNVLRRLRRLARHYGAEPKFLLSSATIRNPQELAEILVDDDVSVVDQDGSPQPCSSLLEPENGTRRADRRAQAVDAERIPSR
jgi:DEAD/DEAH box helicase domain-containing protein